MPAADFLFSLYQNSGPALQIIIILGGTYVWLHDLKPRLNEVEQTQEQRAERWDEQELNAQERTLLLDDAQGRLKQLEDAYDRLRNRLRALEQSHAAEHGERPDCGSKWDGGD